MSYSLVVSEVRHGIFEERNLDAVGFCNLLQKDISLILPEGAYDVNEKLASTMVKVKVQEAEYLNPMNMVNVVKKVMDEKGKPEAIVFTSSSSGSELASYVAGFFNLPLITDVSGFDKEKMVFHKSYYSDKIFGEFKAAGPGPFVITVRSGSFKENAVEKTQVAAEESLDGIQLTDSRTFVEYVEEEKSEVDITKADFLISVGRGIGNKDEIPDYMELADAMKGVLSGSRPVIDKQWLPKARQVGTSGKTVKPKVYLAMGISGAFQHIAGMKESDCIIAVNKDPEAPIFQYAHYGIIGDVHKVRDKIKDILRG
ncbi:MAG: electron transfer flavoprotein subunit alpha/FixB family protein [Syntrophobacterales bacterium]|jgi:electron transfer flavoprotein alpha subunit|nr:electron transfer flavoprotein subunit alpha/FixB family protein [Syntrophobacterales bacterium]